MLSPDRIIDSGDTSPAEPTTPGGENSGKKKLKTLGFSNEPWPCIVLEVNEQIVGRCELEMIHKHLYKLHKHHTHNVWFHSHKSGYPIRHVILQTHRAEE